MILLEPAYKILHTTVKFKRRTIHFGEVKHVETRMQFDYRVS